MYTLFVLFKIYSDKVLNYIQIALKHSLMTLPEWTLYRPFHTNVFYALSVSLPLLRKIRIHACLKNVLFWNTLHTYLGKGYFQKVLDEMHSKPHALSAHLHKCQKYTLKQYISNMTIMHCSGICFISPLEKHNKTIFPVRCTLNLWTLSVFASSDDNTLILPLRSLLIQ